MLTTFKKIHAYEIIDRNVREQDISIAWLGDLTKMVARWQNGPAFTLILDGEVVACGGIVDLGWNRGEAWLLLSTLFYKRPKACIRAIKEKLKEITAQQGFHRVQAAVFSDQEKSVRFIKYLGFKQEGLMKSYGPNGEDFLMFARTGEA